MRDGGFLVTVLILNIVLSGFAPFSPRLYHPRILHLHYHTSHGLIIKIITIIGKRTKNESSPCGIRVGSGLGGSRD